MKCIIILKCRANKMLFKPNEFICPPALQADYLEIPAPGVPLPHVHSSVSVSRVLELQTCVTYQGFQIIVFNRYVVKCFKPLTLFFQDMNEPSSFVNGTVTNRCRNDTLNYPPYFPGRI